MSNKDLNNVTRGRVHAKDFAQKAESINPIVYLIIIALIALAFKAVTV